MGKPLSAAEVLQAQRLLVGGPGSALGSGVQRIWD